MKVHQLNCHHMSGGKNNTAGAYNVTGGYLSVTGKLTKHCLCLDLHEYSKALCS